MDLQQFIQHKPNCPICGHKLYLKLSSTRDYKYKYEEESVVFSTTMKALNKNTSTLDFDIVMNLKDSEFHIDFYDRSLKKLNEYIPNSFINSFKEFNNNQKGLRFSRKCGSCYQYKYESKHFPLNFKSGKVDSLNIESETIVYHKPVDDEHIRIFKIHFAEPSNCSTLCYKEVTNEELENVYPYNGMHLNFENKIICPYRLDVFNGLDNSLEKLETLLTFS